MVGTGNENNAVRLAAYVLDMHKHSAQYAATNTSDTFTHGQELIALCHPDSAKVCIDTQAVQRTIIRDSVPNVTVQFAWGDVPLNW